MIQIGGAEGVRTPDLLDAIEARSQLRHGPTGHMSDVAFIAPPPQTVKHALKARKPPRNLLRSLRLCRTDQKILPGTIDGYPSRFFLVFLEPEQ